ncbi:hypothetical protein KAX75_01960 [candidate division WOR-3 bacterium]|nr:hypothetical protein [candidate division WOR-3 bacterium]
MKRVFRSSLPMLIAALLILAITNCGADKEEAKAPESVPETEPAVTVVDYLGEGVVLAAYTFEDDFFGTCFYPAKIITEPSEKTKGEYQVMGITGTHDVAEGQKQWTKNVVLKSHPAKKDELKPGMVVLYTGVGSAPTPAPDGELPYNRWRRAYILKTDELFKGIVEAKLPEGYSGPVHIRNIRVCDEPKMELPEKLKEE